MTRSLAVHGISYGKLVDEVRFEVARDNLRKPHMRIFDVARTAGFKDLVNFTRMFRRIAGITPGRFRRIVLIEESPTGPQVTQ